MKPEKIGKIQFETTPLKRNVFFLKSFSSLSFIWYFAWTRPSRGEGRPKAKEEAALPVLHCFSLTSLSDVCQKKQNKQKTNKKQTILTPEQEGKTRYEKKLSFRSGVNVPPKTAALVMDRDVPFTSCSRSVSSQWKPIKPADTRWKPVKIRREPHKSVLTQNNTVKLGKNPVKLSTDQNSAVKVGKTGKKPSTGQNKAVKLGKTR